ncbi:MAG: hypothetical protein RAP03_06975, partial [Candidatus Electryonea clarkiae]|nr:hypothetical protein [Candidatus Electryonea clarkiae]
MKRIVLAVIMLLSLFSPLFANEIRIIKMYYGKKRFITIVAAISFAISGISLVSTAQVRSILDNGALWVGDSFIQCKDGKPVLNNPYLYIADGYGVRLHRITNIDDSTEIAFLNRSPGQSGRLLNLGNLIIWAGHRIFIAERNNNNIIKRFEGDFEGFGNQFDDLISVTSDSLILSIDGILEIVDPENPEVILSSNGIGYNSIIVGDRIFSIKTILDENYDRTYQFRVYDISDLESIAFIDSMDIEYQTNHDVSPKRVGNTLAFQHV